jgi:hypothetical protein
MAIIPPPTICKPKNFYLFLHMVDGRRRWSNKLIERVP